MSLVQFLKEFYEAGFKNYGEVRRYVSRYGFNEDVLKQKISSLSGGKKYSSIS